MGSEQLVPVVLVAEEEGGGAEVGLLRPRLWFEGVGSSIATHNSPSLYLPFLVQVFRVSEKPKNRTPAISLS